MGIAAGCRRRRWVTCLALAGYALVMSGLPLSLGTVSVQGRSDGVADQLLAAKDRSRPFPCRDKPCGCVSAEQCFKTCCCHTPAQLLAWARRHDVEPAVLAALERRTAEESPGRSMAASCCATTSAAAAACCAPQNAPKPVTDCCTAARATARLTAGGCERERPADGDTCREGRPRGEAVLVAVDPATPPEATAPDDAPVSTHTLVLRSMLACGGIVAEWFSVGGAPPPLAVIAVACVSPPAVTLVACDEAPRPRHVAPDVPPPRVA